MTNIYLDLLRRADTYLKSKHPTDAVEYFRVLAQSTSTEVPIIEAQHMARVLLGDSTYQCLQKGAMTVKEVVQDIEKKAVRVIGRHQFFHRPLYISQLSWPQWVLYQI